MSARIGRSSRWSAGVACALVVASGWVLAGSEPRLYAQSPAKVLEDFQATDEHEFPIGWEAQRSKERAREAYKIHAGENGPFLAARSPDQRIFKRVAWDPKVYPVITWTWRLRSSPPDGVERVATVYITLDTDLFFIPVFTKYSWSLTKREGTTTYGGMFSGSEIVVQSGPTPIGEWIEERVNAYEDFKDLHEHEPAPEAWGVSLLAEPGVEIDFGPITAHAQ